MGGAPGAARERALRHRVRRADDVRRDRARDGEALGGAAGVSIERYGRAFASEAELRRFEAATSGIELRNELEREMYERYTGPWRPFVDGPADYLKPALKVGVQQFRIT